jgi:hypothetical protein
MEEEMKKTFAGLAALGFMVTALLLVAGADGGAECR